MLRIITVINQFLHFDMRTGFLLQSASFEVRRVPVLQRRIDISRVCVVSLNEIRVVAIHGPHEISDAFLHGMLDLRCKPACLCHEFHGKVGHARLMIARQHWFHHYRKHGANNFAGWNAGLQYIKINNLVI